MSSLRERIAEALDGEALYHKHCGSSVTDHARYYGMMNPAVKEDWERLADQISLLLANHGYCSTCIGTGEFDHGSGEGRVEECVRDDRADPPHRYCPCKRCDATGLADDVRRFLEYPNGH